MGTSQQLSTSLVRTGELGDLPLGRDTVTPRGAGSRHIANAGSVPPVVTANHNARTSCRAPPSAFGHLLSPRQQYPANSTPSYRDAALLAAQHGLSAYAPSAAATASRNNHTPRAGAKGRPPPAPRPMQHSAPAPNPYQTLGPDSLPSCSGASPSPRRSTIPQSRVGLLASRGSAPTPNSAHRSSDAAAALTSAAGHRSSDVASVTYNDGLWRAGSVEQQPQSQPDDMTPAAPHSHMPHALGPTTGTMRVMSPSWGTAQPSVYEADGRPGTRGGGPQYDIEGRPMTRGAQRPPSRAHLQLSLPQPRPPGHVAPLVLGPAWAGLFAGGSGTGPGEAPPAQTPTSPRAPSAGAPRTSWSGEGTELPAGAHRRQPLPLPPAMSGSASTTGGGSGSGSAALGFSTPSGAVGSGAGRGPSVLLALAPAQPGGPPLSGLVATFPTGQAATGQLGYGAGGVGPIAGSGCAGGMLFSPKLSSIAEGPLSPAVSLKGGILARLGSLTGSERKAAQQPGLASASAPVPMSRSRDSSDDNMSDEGANDDSYRSSPDQDSGSNRGSGRTRPRSTPGNTQIPDLHRQHSANGGNRQGGLSTGPSSPTHETPTTKPRR